MEILLLILVIVISYLLGSINTSILVSRVYGGDVREHGSGNAGATNTLRTFGKTAAVFVLIGDVLKGIAAIFICGMLTALFAALNQGVFSDINIYRYSAGFFAVLGHNFPVYFKFKGGKGVLTSATVIAVLAPVIFFYAIAVFALTVIISRYVSLGSVLAAVTFVILTLVWNGGNAAFLVFAVCIGALVIFMHRANIVRLIKGTESKLSFKKNK